MGITRSPESISNMYCDTYISTMSMTSDSTGALYTYHPQVYTQETLAKRPHCIWCGQRLPFDVYDCPFCGGYQDE